jgi:hypothetical protein
VGELRRGNNLFDLDVAESRLLTCLWAKTRSCPSYVGVSQEFSPVACRCLALSKGKRQIIRGVMIDEGGLLYFYLGKGAED